MMKFKKAVAVFSSCLSIGAGLCALTGCSQDPGVEQQDISQEAKELVNKFKNSSQKDTFSLKNLSSLFEEAREGVKNYQYDYISADEIAEEYDLDNYLYTDYYNGRKVFIIEPADSDSDITVINIHGGGFVNNIGKSTWVFYDRLASQTGATVVIPDYPLATGEGYEVDETYDMLECIYDDLLYEGDDIIISGDSAGAGLALGFTEYLQAFEYPLPEKLVLISPWVDITISDQKSESIDKEDVVLDLEGLREIGLFWAGDYDTDYYRISPLNGITPGLPDTIIFAGTKEILYPQAVRLYEGLKECGVNVTLVKGNGLFHDYVLQNIPEGEEALDRISTFITE